MEKKRTKINTIGLDARGLKVIEFFIKNFCDERCVLVSEEIEAEVCMINMDSIGAENELQRIKGIFPQMPIIQMALYSIECYPHFFIRKPLIIKHFLEILVKIESMPNRQISSEQLEFQLKKDRACSALLEEKVYEQLDKTRTVASNASHANNQMRIVEFAGTKNNIDLFDNKVREEIYFDPQDYYLFYVQQAIEQAKLENKPVQLTGLWQTIIICPQFNLVYMTNSDKKLRSFCAAALNSSHKERMLIEETSFSCEEVMGNDADSLMNDSRSENLHDLEQFLWKVSLWTARGRLPLGTDLKQLFQAQSWPNFTRLITTPHSFNLVAYWATKPRSLIETAENLGFEQRYIFSLYTAMTVLNNIERLSLKDEEGMSLKTALETKRLIASKTKKIFSSVVKKMKLGS